VLRLMQRNVLVLREAHMAVNSVRQNVGSLHEQPAKTGWLTCDMDMPAPE